VSGEQQIGWSTGKAFIDNYQYTDYRLHRPSSMKGGRMALLPACCDGCCDGDDCC
jgi:hypothetical protein